MLFGCVLKYGSGRPLSVRTPERRNIDPIKLPFGQRDVCPGVSTRIHLAVCTWLLPNASTRVNTSSVEGFFQKPLGLGPSTITLPHIRPSPVLRGFIPNYCIPGHVTEPATERGVPSNASGQVDVRWTAVRSKACPSQTIDKPCSNGLYTFSGQQCRVSVNKYQYIYIQHNTTIQHQHEGALIWIACKWYTGGVLYGFGFCIFHLIRFCTASWNKVIYQSIWIQWLTQVWLAVI